MGSIFPDNWYCPPPLPPLHLELGYTVQVMATRIDYQKNIKLLPED